MHYFSSNYAKPCLLRSEPIIEFFFLLFFFFLKWEGSTMRVLSRIVTLPHQGEQLLQSIRLRFKLSRRSAGSAAWLRVRSFGVFFCIVQTVSHPCCPLCSTVCVLCYAMLCNTMLCWAHNVFNTSACSISFYRAIVLIQCKIVGGGEKDWGRRAGASALAYIYNGNS